jgi:hypothetical protein
MSEPFNVARLIAATLFAGALLAGCGLGPPHGHGTDMAEAVAAIERARFEAMTQQDVTALEPLLADDLVYCHSNGLCETKAQFLDTIASGRLRYRAIEVEHLAPRPVAGAWIVNGVVAVEAEADGQINSMRLSFTDVYAPASGGGWQLTAWHSARAP